MSDIDLNRPNAAIMTAGSFVLIALTSGTTFSCTVYLSKILLLFFLADAVSFPPQSVLRASRPRILIIKLDVLANTVAITGKSSFLMVEKSSFGNMMDRLSSVLSMMADVGDCSACT